MKKTSSGDAVIFAPSGRTADCRPESFLAGPGAVYLAARYGLGVLVSLGNMLVLTWWIGPHAYGLFVTAIGLMAFLSTLARAGVDTYLVRAEQPPNERLYAVAGTLVLAVSTALLLIGAALVPPLIRWFGNREFVAPYIVLLFSIPIIGMTGIPTAKLERELDFRRLAGIEVTGQLLGLVVSCALAWRGFGVWAAVAGQTTWQVFLMIATFAAARVFPRLAFDRLEARKMLVYGLSVTASLRTWQVRTLVNPLLVGRFAGADAVAYVALAIRIAEALGSIRLAAGRVAIASFARLQHNRDLLLHALQESLFLQVITLGPLLCIFAVSGPWVVQHVLGSRWSASLTIYPFVAAGVLVNSVYNLQASALFVSGEAGVVTKCYLAHVTLLTAGTYVLLPHAGISGYGWAELLACIAYALIHRAFAGTLSYRKVTPWLVIFMGLIFFRAATSNRISLSIIALAIAAAGWKLLGKQSPARLWELSRRVGRRLSPAVGTLVLVCLALPAVVRAQNISAEGVRAAVPIPATLFGMHFRLDKLDWPDVPFGALRLWDTDTNWQRLNSAPGKYDFSTLDRYLGAAHDHHLSDVLLTLGGTPTWASSGPTDRGCDNSAFGAGSCHPPADLSPDGTGPNRYWRDFLYNLGTHLAGLRREQYSTVNFFSVWNEFTRGADSQHASWLGTDAQMLRIVQDANCILLGRAPSTLDCTFAAINEPAVALLTSGEMTTPDAVPLPPDLKVFAAYLTEKRALDSIGVIAVHAYAHAGAGKTFPEIGASGLVEEWSALQSILPAGVDLPVWSTEGGWGDTERNLPDPDMQVGYLARYYLVGWSLGFQRLYWYAADNNWGRLIDQKGHGGCVAHAGCPSAAATAWKQVYGWMVGNRMSRACAPAASSDIWSCTLEKPDGTKLVAVWDVSKSCAYGTCTTSNYRYPAGFVCYLTLHDDKSRALTSGTVAIGWQPILLSQNCNDKIIS